MKRHPILATALAARSIFARSSGSTLRHSRKAALAAATAASTSAAPASATFPRDSPVPGLIVSPHSFARGNRARSSINTRAPPRASTVAAIEPAGPAPQTITSNISY